MITICKKKTKKQKNKPVYQFCILFKKKQITALAGVTWWIERRL